MALIFAHKPPNTFDWIVVKQEYEDSLTAEVLSKNHRTEEEANNYVRFYKSQEQYAKTEE